MEPLESGLLLEFRNGFDCAPKRVYFVRGRTLRWILEANPEIQKLLAGRRRFKCRSGTKTRTITRGYRPKNCDIIYY